MPGLMDVPGLGGYLGAQQADQAQQMGQLQQLGLVQGILAKQQAAQRVQQIKGVLSQTDGDPKKAIPALVQLGTPESLTIAAHLHSLIPTKQYSAAGNGILDNSSGVVTPNAYAKTPTQPPSNLSRLISEKNSLPPGDPRIATYDDAIRKESQTAKQISPTVVMPSAPQLHTDEKGMLWERDRSGSWNPAMGPDGKQLGSKVTSNPAAEQIYKDYSSNPQVKEANDLEVKIKPLADYMINFKKTGQSVNSNDAALAKAYLAVTTSLGNRAYVADKRELAQLPNLTDRLGNMASSFFAGKDLTDQTRTEMFNYIVQRYKGLDQARQQQRDFHTKRAQARGIPVDQIFGAQD